MKRIIVTLVLFAGLASNDLLSLGFPNIPSDKALVSALEGSGTGFAFGALGSLALRLITNKPIGSTRTGIMALLGVWGVCSFAISKIHNSNEVKTTKRDSHTIESETKNGHSDGLKKTLWALVTLAPVIGLLGFAG